MIGIGISIPMMMPFAEDATAFVRSGVLRSPLAITRAQTGGVQSTAINGGNNGLTFYGADVPRFTGPAQRLLIEGQGTNTIQNPWCEGAVAGSPGTMPTRWSVTGSSVGLTRTVVAAGVENGIPYVDLRFNGTATAGLNVDIPLDALSASAASGQTWTSAVYVQRIGGSLTNISSPAIYVREWSSGFVFLNQFSLGVSSDFSNLLDSRRVLVATLANASTALVDLAFQFNPTVGSPVDVTFRIGAPQLKQLPFADTPSFPPAGTPGASTRGADLVSASLSSLGIAASGACTVLWSGVVPNFITGATHTIACLDDGSVNNRFTMRIDQASGQLQAQRSLAGASTTANAGGVTAGAAIKGGMALNGSGRAAVSLNGGAVAAVTGGPSSGLTQCRLGNIFDGSAPMWGETTSLRILPFVSDSDLQSLTGAMP